ncbi:hypothetical protein [Burkholderia cepacia]|uniref:hypothetical protein n=1 Tax=Burkholderia cepacia TaxID=292 RepID=UPI000A801562|nr:hypothetical protein [Burkholderia cepacia]
MLETDQRRHAAGFEVAARRLTSNHTLICGAASARKGSRDRPHLAKRRTSRVHMEATGKLGQPKQQLHA